MSFDYKPLTLDCRPLVMEWLKKFPPTISEMTFSNLYMWREKRPLRMLFLDQTLLFFLEGEPLTLFGPPIGPLTLEEATKKLPIQRVERVVSPPKISGWNFVDLPSQADYLYKVEDLINLPGHTFHRQRQLIHGALSRYECLYEAITTKNLSECRHFLEKHPVPAEKAASDLLLDHFEEWELQGCVVRIEDQIEAVMVGEPLNPNTFVAHLARVEKTKHGLYALLDHWFAERVAKGYDYLNLEQDLGIEGLKVAKERLQPDQQILKYSGSRIDI